MAFPLLAPLVYGAIAGGGLVGAAAAIEQIYRWFSADDPGRKKMDDDVEEGIKPLLNGIARRMFGTSYESLESEKKKIVQQEAKTEMENEMGQIDEFFLRNLGRNFPH
jgi:hypothetical protein